MKNGCDVRTSQYSRNATHYASAMEASQHSICEYRCPTSVSIVVEQHNTDQPFKPCLAAMAGPSRPSASRSADKGRPEPPDRLNCLMSCLSKATNWRCPASMRRPAHVDGEEEPEGWHICPAAQGWLGRGRPSRMAHPARPPPPGTPPPPPHPPPWSPRRPPPRPAAAAAPHSAGGPAFARQPCAAALPHRCAGAGSGRRAEGVRARASPACRAPRPPAPGPPETAGRWHQRPGPSCCAARHLARPARALPAHRGASTSV